MQDLQDTVLLTIARFRTAGLVKVRALFAKRSFSPDTSPSSGLCMGGGGSAEPTLSDGVFKRAGEASQVAREKPESKEGGQDRGRRSHRTRGKGGASEGLEKVESPRGGLEARLTAILAELS